MNDSHLHIDPTSQTEIDYPGRRRDCAVCQAHAADQKPASKKPPAKAE